MLLTDEQIDWDLKLTALCTEDRQRAIRFLTGAVVACGGWVLSRSIAGSESAEISFEFARVVSVEIYGILIAAGLELGCDSHLRMTELCQCTKNLMPSCAYEVARIRLCLFEKPLAQENKKEDKKPVKSA